VAIDELDTSGHRDPRAIRWRDPERHLDNGVVDAKPAARFIYLQRA
jgi:hypothetical protein